MKIRSTSELNERLSEALVWRKRELSALHMQIQGQSREHERKALRRAAVPILYSHWEGFVKEAASSYLELVSRQRLRYRDLKSCFVTLACRSALREAGRSGRPHIQGQVVDFLLFNQDEKASIPYKQEIDPRSNLSAETFRGILFSVGVPYDDQWSSKELLIDGSLLKTRNEVAHGSRVEVDQQTYEQLKDLVTFLIDRAKDCIENAAVTRGYRRSGSVTPTPKR